MNRFDIALVLLLATATAAFAQSPSTVTDGPNGTRVAVSGHEGARAFHSRWGYVPAVRAGDMIMMAGVIAAPAPNDGRDAEAFKRGLRRAFEDLRENLRVLDASLDDVVKINTYHVFDSDWFDGDKMAHMEAVREIKHEYMSGATPAWSAIGVNELFSDSGLVEIELTVYAPRGK